MCCASRGRTHHDRSAITKGYWRTKLKEELAKNNVFLLAVLSLSVLSIPFPAFQPCWLKYCMSTWLFPHLLHFTLNAKTGSTIFAAQTRTDLRRPQFSVHVIQHRNAKSICFIHKIVVQIKLVCVQLGTDQILK